MNQHDDDLRGLIEGEREILAWLNGPADTLEERLALLRQLEGSGVLARLCDLADLQAQALISRYRPALIGRLLSLATAEDAPPEQARRALVDLLKLDLRPKQAGLDADDPEAEGFRKQIDGLVKQLATDASKGDA